PPWWIRGILILTCTGVSFAHGSNDGQKGMGLIMLILVGTVPLSYALNRAMPADQMVQFTAMAQVTHASLTKAYPAAAPADVRATLSEFVRTKEVKPEVMPALAAAISSIGDQVKQYGSLAKIPSAAVPNVRNDMYLASESIRIVAKSDKVKLDADATAN